MTANNRAPARFPASGFLPADEFPERGMSARAPCRGACTPCNGDCNQGRTCPKQKLAHPERNPLHVPDVRGLRRVMGITMAVWLVAVVVAIARSVRW